FWQLCKSDSENNCENNDLQHLIFMNGFDNIFWENISKKCGGFKNPMCRFGDLFQSLKVAILGGRSFGEFMLRNFRHINADSCLGNINRGKANKKSQCSSSIKIKQRFPRHSAHLFQI